MAKTKTPNYTPEQEAEISGALAGLDMDRPEDAEKARERLAALAERFGKSLHSVRQKAVRMGLYHKPAYVGKTGRKPRSKAAIVEAIAASLGVPSEVAESLEKANKAILERLEAALAKHT